MHRFSPIPDGVIIDILKYTSNVNNRLFTMDQLLQSRIFSEYKKQLVQKKIIIVISGIYKSKFIPSVWKFSDNCLDFFGFIFSIFRWYKIKSIARIIAGCLNFVSASPLLLLLLLVTYGGESATGTINSSIVLSPTTASTVFSLRSNDLSTPRYNTVK